MKRIRLWVLLGILFVTGACQFLAYDLTTGRPLWP